MLWIMGALAIGYTSIYAAFRELTNDIGMTVRSRAYRALRSAVALSLGIGSVSIISHHAVFDHRSHTLQPWPLLAWFIAALLLCFIVIYRIRLGCDEKRATLNILGACVSTLVILLNCALLASNGKTLLPALSSPTFWTLAAVNVAIITFAFYACSLVSRLLGRPSMLNYRYFTRPLMLTFCLALGQIVGAMWYPRIGEFSVFDDTLVVLSREQLLLGVALISSVVSSALLGSNFYARYLNTDASTVNNLSNPQTSGHSFWQAFIALIALSLVLITLVFWLQWHSAITQKNSVTAVSMQNALKTIQNELDSLATDIETVRHTLSIHPNKVQLDEEYSSQLTNFLTGYSLATDRYRYLAILNSEGNEVVRLDNSATTPSFSTAPHESEMFYAIEHRLALASINNGAFISNVSIARQNAKPITPLSPIIKVGAPIIDENGKHAGTLVFSYRFDRFVSLLSQFFSSNTHAYLLNESNQVLIDLSSPKSWEHLLYVSSFRFIPLENNQLAIDTIYTSEQQTHILNAGLLTTRLESTFFYSPSWRLVVKSDYPAIQAKPWNLSFIALLVGISYLLAKFISKAILSNINSRQKISELLNEVGYQKQALDEHAIVSITDQRGIITYVNDKFCEISGYQESELIGQNHRLLKSDEHSPEFFKQLWRTIANGNVWSGEIKNLRKNGSIYWVHATILPIRGTSGKVERYIAVRTDITESRVVASILEDALKEAHQAAEAKNRFIANISHEIRTPMNAIIGLTEACLVSPNKQNQQDLIRKVFNSANNLLRIINDILDFSKMEAGHMEVEAISFSIENVIEEHVYVHQSVARAKGIHLLTGIDSGVPYNLIGDPLRIGQVISNLVSNALKFTHKGEVIVYVKVRQHKGEFVDLEFSVQDTGTGMTEEQIGKLFSPFSQADISTTRKYGGTGLGLSICKSLVGIMGGTIQVESQPGEGSVFRFFVPLKISLEKTIHPSNEMSLSLKQQNVLLIDFVGVSRQNYIRYTNALEMNLDTASTSAEVSTLLNGHTLYDYLIVDCYHLTGELQQLLSQLRRYVASASLKSIILIDYGEDLSEALQWHTSTTTITPPISQSSLLDAMIPFQHQSKQALRHDLQTDHTPNFSHLTILVAEDNETNQLVLSEIFNSWKAEYYMVSNGREAIKMVQQKAFDLVLMDIQMPIMDGYEACRGIRALGGEYLKLPIIAVTANTTSQDIQKALNAGMNDHISKPISRQRLQNIISQQTIANNSVINPNTDNSQGVEPSGNDLLLLEILSNHLASIAPKDALQRLGVEPAFYLQLLKSFKNSSEKHLATVYQAYEQENYSELAAVLHSIKGIAGNLGAMGISQTAKTLEDMANNHQFDKTLLDSILFDVQDVNLAIQQAINEVEQLSQKDTSSSPNTRLTLQECEELFTLIDSFDTKANDLIRQLLEQHKGAAAFTTLQAIDDQLSNYNFEEAATLLRDLMDSIHE